MHGLHDLVDLPWSHPHQQWQAESDHNFGIACALCASFADRPPTRKEFQARPVEHMNGF